MRNAKCEIRNISNRNNPIWHGFAALVAQLANGLKSLIFITVGERSVLYGILQQSFFFLPLRPTKKL
jgi:hypothetical protein